MRRVLKEVGQWLCGQRESPKSEEKKMLMANVG